MTSIGHPVAVGGLHLGPRRQILSAADAVGARREAGLRRAEAGAQHDTRREAELPRHERHRHRELLVIADGGDVVVRLPRRAGRSRVRRRRLNIASMRDERVSGGARLERVVGERRHPLGRTRVLREAVTEVSALAQQRHQAGERRAPGARRVLIDPLAHAVGRRDARAHPAGRIDRGEVRLVAARRRGRRTRRPTRSPPAAVWTPADAAAL